MGKKLGSGKIHNSLYYLENERERLNDSLLECALSTEKASSELLLHHERLGHVTFHTLCQLFPTLSQACKIVTLVCDEYEFAKYT